MNQLPGLTRIRVPAHAAAEAIKVFQARLKTRITQQGKPYWREPEVCAECDAIRAQNRALESAYVSAIEDVRSLLAARDNASAYAAYERAREAGGEIEYERISPQSGEEWVAWEAGFPWTPLGTVPHNHYLGRAQWMIDLMGETDPKIRFNGKALSDAEFRKLARRGESCGKYVYDPEDRAAGVASEPQGGAADPPARPIAEVDMADVYAAFKVCAPVCQRNETRLNLAGVNVSTQPGRIRFEATDGHRLTVYNLAGADDLIPAHTIIPREWCEGVVKAKPKGTAQLALVLEDTDDGEQEARLHLILPSGERSPAINGRFPCCDPIIPRLDNCLWHATLPLAEALARLKGVARIDNDRIKAVKLMIDGSGARLESEDAEYGQADTTIPVLELDGDFSEPIGFNAPYLIDALKLYKADTVTISGRGRLNPLRLTIPGLDHIAMVVMPLRIEW